MGTPLDRLPVTDNHMHIDPMNGMGIEAVKGFLKSGGKNIILVNKLTKDWGVVVNDESGFRQLFDHTISLSRDIQEKTGARAFPVIGIHPAEFHFLMEKFGMEKSMAIAKGAIDIASEMISDNKAVAMGEIGRPHYPADAQVIEACNQLMEYAFMKAAEVDCPVQLHTESISEDNYDEFSELAKRAGLAPKKIVKHYSPPFVSRGMETGVFPSLISSMENIQSALKQGTRFVMESDYIDDLKRPGAVTGPKSVPRVTQRLLSSGIISQEDIWKIHHDNIEEIYGIEL